MYKTAPSHVFEWPRKYHEVLELSLEIHFLLTLGGPKFHMALLSVFINVKLILTPNI